VLGVLAVGGFIAARESSAFAITTIEVQGSAPPVAAQVRRALGPLVGTSLLKLDPADVERLVLALPQVASVRYDRSFPHALVLQIAAERPLVVVRHGPDAWLVSRHARVIRRVAPGSRLSLPRVWLPRAVDVRIGGTLASDGGSDEVDSLLPVAEAGLGGRVASVRVEKGRVVYKLRNGLELRAGRPSNLRLKLAVAARIVDQNAVRDYLDVSVPTRPVGHIDPQLSG